MQRENVRLGGALALATAAISGISVYVAKFGTQAVPDPFVYATARNLTVGILLLAILISTGRVSEVRRLSASSWRRLALIPLIGGSVPFLLFFWGLTMTSASMGSLIQKTQFLWVALFAAPLLGEKLGKWGWVGLIALSFGVALQGPVALTGAGMGAALILLATLLWTAETILVRQTLRDVSPALAATARMAGGAIVLLLVLGVTGHLRILFGLNATQALWVVVPSVLLFGYVTTWYTALRHAPAAVVTGVLALGAPITALLSAASTGSLLALKLTGSPTQWSMASGSILSTALVLLGSSVVIVAWRLAQNVPEPSTVEE